MKTARHAKYRRWCWPKDGSRLCRGRRESRPRCLGKSTASGRVDRGLRAALRLVCRMTCTRCKRCLRLSPGSLSFARQPLPGSRVGRERVGPPGFIGFRTLSTAGGRAAWCNTATRVRLDGDMPRDEMFRVERGVVAVRGFLLHMTACRRIVARGWICRKR